HARVSWQEESNHAIREASEDWHNTTEIPWAQVADEEGESLFWDGIHLTPKGAGVYARLVSKVLHEKLAFPKGGGLGPPEPPPGAGEGGEGKGRGRLGHGPGRLWPWPRRPGRGR